MVQQPAPRKWQGVPGFISWPWMVPATQPSQQAVQLPHCLGAGSRIAITAPWHFLYFWPLPQGQGSFRPTRIRRCSVYSPCRAPESCPAWENAALGSAAVTLYLVVAASVLTSIAQRGSKVTLSLYALELGAGS